MGDDSSVDVPSFFGLYIEGDGVHVSRLGDKIQSAFSPVSRSGSMYSSRPKGVNLREGISSRRLDIDHLGPRLGQLGSGKLVADPP